MGVLDSANRSGESQLNFRDVRPVLARREWVLAYEAVQSRSALSDIAESTLTIGHFGQGRLQVKGCLYG